MIVSGRLEAPNERSMHAVPVPVGAGVAIVAVALSLWAFSQGLALHGGHLMLGAALAGLAALSWTDDRHPLSPGVRLAVQVLAIAALLLSLEPEARALPGLPLPVERVLLALAWLWFVNLFNFMDGIDGLAASEAIAVAAGALLHRGHRRIKGTLWVPTLIVAAATLGYLLSTGPRRSCSWATRDRFPSVFSSAG